MNDLSTASALAADRMQEAVRGLAARRDPPWARRPLSGGLFLLLWAMRVYVVLMLVVVAVQLLRLA